LIADRRDGDKDDRDDDLISTGCTSPSNSNGCSPASWSFVVNCLVSVKAVVKDWSENTTSGNSNQEWKSFNGSLASAVTGSLFSVDDFIAFWDIDWSGITADDNDERSDEECSQDNSLHVD
jgi:hypothetical protein